MPLPALEDIAAEVEGRGKVRVTWRDLDETPLFYIVYAGETDNFPDAQPVAMVPGTARGEDGQFGVTVRDLPDSTELWFFAQSFTPDDQSGPTSDEATVTTPDAPTEGPSRLSPAKQAVVDFVASVVPAETPIVWRYGGQPRPSKSFVELHFSNPERRGQDHDDGEKLQGLRFLHLTMTVYADKQETSLDLAEDLHTATERNDKLEPFQDAGFAFGEVAQVLDLSGELDTKFEGRHQFEAVVHATSSIDLTNEVIDTVTMTGTIE